MSPSALAVLDDSPRADRADPLSATVLLTDLLQRTSLGEECAFAALYERMSPRVYGLVLRVLRDPAQSEEVTQEVCLEVWRTASRFDPAKGHVMSWILGMAHRRAVDRVRASQASARRDARHHEQLPQALPDVTSETAMSSVEAQRVRAALTTLGPDQLRVLELVYFSGYSHSEVAVLLGIPLGTAKSRIREGLRRLRESLPPPTPLVA